MKSRFIVSAVAALALGVGLSSPAAAVPAVDNTPPQVTVDTALHFVVGSILTDGSFSPGLVVMEKWHQFDASGICSGGGNVQEFIGGWTVRASWSDVRTTINFPLAHIGDSAMASVRATDCSPAANSTTASGFHGTDLRQENVASFSPGWTTSNCACFSGGADIHSARAGASATYQTNAPSLGVVSNKASNRGTVDIFVDGVKKARVNLFSSSPINRVVIYQKYWTAPGPHTVELRVVSGRVDLDGFVESN